MDDGGTHVTGNTVSENSAVDNGGGLFGLGTHTITGNTVVKTQLGTVAAVCTFIGHSHDHWEHSK